MGSFAIYALIAVSVSLPGSLVSSVSTVKPQRLGELSIQVDSLPVAPERPTGYKRSLFPHWTTQPNGCSTREVVLISQSLAPAVVAASNCKVRSGLWTSTYDGLVLTDPRKIDIDHVVALKEAWDSGAHAWSRTRRRAFANDISHQDSLIAVSSASNRSKSDKDPAQWLPRYVDQCRYVEAWVGVKLRWGLSADQREVDALRTIATRCDQL